MMNRIMTGVAIMKKMKAYASFDLWKKDQSKKNQTLIALLRKIISGSGLPLEETVKWGNGAWVKRKIPYIYIDAKYFTALMKQAIKIKYR